MSYAAQRNVLFTSAASILGETWKINFLLYVVKPKNYDINRALFREVQSVIIGTNAAFRWPLFEWSMHF